MNIQRELIVVPGSFPISAFEFPVECLGECFFAGVRMARQACENAVVFIQRQGDVISRFIGPPKRIVGPAVAIEQLGEVAGSSEAIVAGCFACVAVWGKVEKSIGVVAKWVLKPSGF